MNLLVHGAERRPIADGITASRHHHVESGMVAHKKAARRRLSIKCGELDQGAASARPLRDRRYAMKPMPAKPRIIMLHVAGSGTAATAISATETSIPPRKLPIPTELMMYVTSALNRLPTAAAPVKALSGAAARITPVSASSTPLMK